MLIADKDNGVAASLFPYGAHRHLAKSAIWKWIAGRDLKRYEVSERVLSSAIFCQGNVRAGRGKRPRRQEERWTHENPIEEDKEGFTGRAGTILVVLQSRIYLLFQESKVKESSWREIVKFRERKTWRNVSLFLLRHLSLLLSLLVIWKSFCRVPLVLIFQIQLFFPSLLR